MTVNQNPEQIARDTIDRKLIESGFAVQDRKHIVFKESTGIAVRVYPTDVGPADYILFVDRVPVGVIEAKKEDFGEKITTVEGQSYEYAASKLKHLNKDLFRSYMRARGTDQVY
jgi:type I restriction enzyme R subunit